jgi:hypothetical protein
MLLRLVQRTSTSENDIMTPLRQRFIDDLRVRNYSPKTIKAYVAGVVRYSRHFGRSPAESTVEHIRACQIHLLQQQAVWSVYNQSICLCPALPVPHHARPTGSGATHPLW